MTVTKLKLDRFLQESTHLKHSNPQPKSKSKRKRIFILLVVILVFGIVIILPNWPEDFQATVAKELGIKKSDLTNVVIGKAYDKDTHSFRNLGLIGTISNTERDRLLALYTPYSRCDKNCKTAAPWRIPGTSTELAKEAAELLRSNQLRCSIRTIEEPSVQIREDMVCLAPDSTIIWYTSSSFRLGI